MKNNFTKTDWANLCIIFDHICEDIIDLLAKCKENHDSEYYESLAKILKATSNISKETYKYFEKAKDNEK